MAIGFLYFYTSKLFSDENGISSFGLFFAFAWFIITFRIMPSYRHFVMTKLSPQNYKRLLWNVVLVSEDNICWFLLGANIASASENSNKFRKLNIYADGYKQLGIYALIAGVLYLSLFLQL